MAIRPELRDELLSLSAEERQALADELYESIGEQPIDPAWESAWSQEIARRARDVVEGSVELVDASEVHASIRAEFRTPSK